MTTLGWIGLGAMGAPMASNLVKAGFNVGVYNRDQQKAAPFKNSGAKIYEQIADLVEGSDIIFTMLSNDQAVQSVYEQIMTRPSLEGKIFIDMSTVSSQLSQITATQLKAKGAEFLDAPVSGSTKPAAEGTLVIMVGGPVEALEKVRPYLEKLGKAIKYMGLNGKGSATKIAVNYMLALNYLSLAEGTLFAEDQGIDRQQFLEIIGEGAMASGATRLKTPMLIQQDYPPQFALSLMAKDLHLAASAGVSLPLSHALITAFDKASQAGYAEKDVIAIADYLKNKNS